MKKKHIYIAILVGLFVGLIVVEYTKPKPVDWSLSFEKEDKIPYGSLILFEQLPEIFPGANSNSGKPKIEVSEQSIYLLWRDRYLENTNLIFVAEMHEFGATDAQKLLEFASVGNHVFIAANFFDPVLRDSLNLQTEYSYISEVFAQQDSLWLNFQSPSLRRDSNYVFRKGMNYSHFASFDTAKTTVLGFNSRQEANFIRTAYGDGAFYLCTSPRAFTNYGMLTQRNAEYAYKALSFLPNQHTLWDEYYKPNRAESSSSLRYILNRPPLRAAWFLLLAATLLFVVFEAKRRQRVIPVIKPLPNTSLEFAQTVGRLYFQHGNHKDIAEKKFRFFTENLRSKYYVFKFDFNQNTYKKIAEKTGVEQKIIRRIFDSYRLLSQKEKISESELLQINSAIEEFYKKSKI